MNLAKLLTSGVVIGMISMPALAESESQTTSSKINTMKEQAQDTAMDLSEDIQRTVYGFMDKDITTLKFDKNMSSLSELQETKLRALVKSVRDDSKIEKIIVAAWSDKEFPKESGESLSSLDRELAEKRSETIEKSLEMLEVSNIETLSMAEKPNWISKMLFSDEVAIKKSFHGIKADSIGVEAIAEILRSNGGPSAAVVIIQRDNSQNTAANF